MNNNETYYGFAALWSFQGEKGTIVSGRQESIKARDESHAHEQMISALTKLFPHMAPEKIDVTIYDEGELPPEEDDF
ncbi:TPA: hypothetical protein I7730_00460 [Vibrio vulnificus]|uniref:Uncharacterized protein n=1 Tax=Vibrio vulnificus TaxID=672 RepID=A0A8H9K584_VIBVL|nr:hypothetical protein [Vibrio vulnificus]HAS8538270.1 hypothetical protein [Vibrio vulnificus]